MSVSLVILWRKTSCRIRAFEALYANFSFFPSFLGMVADYSEYYSLLSNDNQQQGLFRSELRQGVDDDTMTFEEKGHQRLSNLAIAKHVIFTSLFTVTFKKFEFHSRVTTLLFTNNRFPWPSLRLFGRSGHCRQTTLIHSFALLPFFGKAMPPKGSKIPNRKPNENHTRSDSEILLKVQQQLILDIEAYGDNVGATKIASKRPVLYGPPDYVFSANSKSVSGKKRRVVNTEEDVVTGPLAEAKPPPVQEGPVFANPPPAPADAKEEGKVWVDAVQQLSQPTTADQRGLILASLGIGGAAADDALSMQSEEEDDDDSSM